MAVFTELPTAEEVRTSLVQALEELAERDIYLLVHDLHERTITHKLAEYLQPYFSAWHTDCEYNRDGHNPKRVKLDKSPEEEMDHGSNVFPDIIIHHRGNNDNNLLVIEAKKSDRLNQEIIVHDVVKVEAFVRDLGYEFGAVVTLLVGKDHSPVYDLIFYAHEKWQ